MRAPWTRPNISNGGTSANAIGTSRRVTEPRRSSAIRASCKLTVTPVTPITGMVTNLSRLSADQLVAKSKIADRDLRSGIDHRVERQAGGADLGQNQLAAPAPSGHDDFAVEPFRRQSRVFDLDHARFEIHHQALLDERVDADHALAAEVQFPQHRNLAGS